MKTVSIIVPMYNEEAVIKNFTATLFETLKKIKGYKFEVVFVNDGSKDKTHELQLAEQKEHKEIIIVNLSRNFGHESAVCAGLNIASGDAVIPMDADLQDPPSLIPELIAKWEEGYEVVNAKRSSRKGESLFKKGTAKLFYKTISKWSDKVQIPQNVGHFRLISRRVLEEVNALGEVTRVFRVEVPFVGFKTTEVEFVRPDRKEGHTHYSLKSMNKLAVDSIVATTTKPLHFITNFTLIAFALMFISVIAELVCFIIGCCSTHFISEFWYAIWLVINVILFVSCFIMLALATISQYNSRAFAESQDRPFYIIDNIEKSDDK